MEATSAVVEALKALADPVRLSILEFLWGPVAEEFRDEHGVCAKDVERFLRVTQPTVSYHMKILVGAGLVESEKRGQKVYYECVTEGPGEVIRYLERYRKPRRTPGSAGRPEGWIQGGG
jgi:ArsR family transcriptional regulator